jgi:hypothetical protein
MSAQAEIDDWVYRQLYKQKITLMNNTIPTQYKDGCSAPLLTFSVVCDMT